jgi:hypothetical protein
LIDSPRRGCGIRAATSIFGRGPISSIAAAFPRTLARVLPPWWLFLITGIGWTIVALILLRFDYTTVRAISKTVATGCLRSSW